jgi:predicted transposase/invertase (TIGR01784 family)
MGPNDNLPKILPPKTDIVFKMLFGDERNIDLLIDLLEAILKVKIDSVTLLDTTLKPEHRDDKKGILDVKAKLNTGERVDIEIQVKKFKEMRNRISYYNDHLITEQAGNSDNYDAIKPGISTIIIDYPLIQESEKCHNVFSMLEEEEHFPFSDLKKIHILHLCRIDAEKMPEVADWLKFIRSDKEEDFMVLAQKSKTLSKAFERLKIMSADESNRMLYQARLKELRDQNAAENAAEERGEMKERMKNAKAMKNEGMNVNTIARITGLTAKEIENM